MPFSPLNRIARRSRGVRAALAVALAVAGAALPAPLAAAVTPASGEPSARAVPVTLEFPAGAIATAPSTASLAELAATAPGEHAAGGPGAAAPSVPEPIGRFADTTAAQGSISWPEDEPPRITARTGAELLELRLGEVFGAAAEAPSELVRGLVGAGGTDTAVPAEPRSIRVEGLRSMAACRGGEPPGQEGVLPGVRTAEAEVSAEHISVFGQAVEVGDTAYWELPAEVPVLPRAGRATATVEFEAQVREVRETAGATARALIDITLAGRAYDGAGELLGSAPILRLVLGEVAVDCGEPAPAAADAPATTAPPEPAVPAPSPAPSSREPAPPSSPPPAAAPAEPAGELSVTGVEVAGLIALAATLVVGGATAMVLARRRAAPDGAEETGAEPVP
ncbi:hypothetical protein CLV72_106211 [Allonocardiopsis opalescens]|uniref:Htaa protein n=1 Tax=Allonocardiopsis opalescens TaxID=1144618 RepID=A0A2T0Q0E0_9ACTN|nr:hypothetical protein CLV72_106211 [Allonocardiopsis opalescens]